MRLSRAVKATLGRAVLGGYRTRIVSIGNVPPGGAILAGNHVSYLDPVLLWCAAPRLVYFMAKAELWDSPVLGWTLDRLLAFPVHRNSPDRAALARAGTLLTAGELVGIFPEGTRYRADGTGELGEASEGVAFMALRAGVPVVPVGIHGTSEVFPPGARLPRFPQVTIRFAEPVRPEEFVDGGRKKRIEMMTGEIMSRIADARDKAREA